MKSFIQYITEIVTDAPKKKVDHEHNSHKISNSEHIHTYTYPHPSSHDPEDAIEMAISTKHHKDSDGKIQMNHSSHLAFTVGGSEGRSGVESTKDATKIMSKAVHGTSHHLSTVKPKHFSFSVARHEEEGKSPQARKNIYHKIGHRLAKSHGYELHNIKSGADASKSDLVTYKRIKKK